MRILISIIIAISGYFTFDSIKENEFKTLNSDLVMNENIDESETAPSSGLYEFGHMWGVRSQYSEEYAELREYMLEIRSSYDWVNMTDEEIENALTEIYELILIKSNELGVELHSFNGGYGFGYGYRMHRGIDDDFYNYMEARHELMESYDWNTMTIDEINLARTKIEIELTELYQDFEFTHMWESNWTEYDESRNVRFGGRCH